MTDSIASRAVSGCYALMAAVTVIATAVGFWLSYAGLHAFAARAGLSGPEAWAWPASVDLFILAGELGITISTLRDGRPDWRAWVYFAAGAVPSVAFNVLHVTVQAPGWGKYAVAATPPVAAALALAALMQQVISLPDALAHLHREPAPAGTPGSETASEDVPEFSTAEMHFAADIASGKLPSARRIQREMHVGQPKAAEIRKQLQSVLAG